MSFGILAQSYCPVAVPNYWDCLEPTNELREVASFDGINGEELPHDGIREVIDAIYGLSDYYDYPGPGRMNEVIGREYLRTGKGEYIGSYVKRLRKYLRKQYPSIFERLPQDAWGRIGSIVGQWQNHKILYDIVDTFDWNDGDFGDDGSCFFTGGGCRNFMPRNLERIGARAIRFYDCKGGSEPHGIARAFLLPWHGSRDCVVFNAYGYDKLKVTRIISLLLGAEYRKVQLVNGECGSYGMFYLNNGSGYVLSPIITDYCEDDQIRFDYRIIDKECDSCGADICTERDEYISRNGDYYYCDSCYVECEDCGRKLIGDEQHEAHDSNGNSREVCQYCLHENYHQCPCCDNYVAN